MPIFRSLPFESEVFGRAVACLELDADDREGGFPAWLRGAVEEWRAGGWWLVACRLPESRVTEAKALEAAGFAPVETLVTLERPLSGPMPDVPQAGPACPADADACVEIARRAFVHDRFHADHRVPKDRADEFKARWVRNDFGGRADHIVVVRDDDRPIGFCACLLTGRTAVIDLIATAPDFQGRGLGCSLVSGALAAYADRADVMRVGTQVLNERSLRLYTALGFAEASRSRTLHWLDEQAP